MVYAKSKQVVNLLWRQLTELLLEAVLNFAWPVTTELPSIRLRLKLVSLKSKLVFSLGVVEP